MAVYVNPIDNPEDWNVLRFPTAQLSTPADAKCVVGKWTRDNEYDVKAGKGTQGATETLKQQPPAKGTITFWAWTPAHFDAWNAILDLLRFDPTKGGNTTSTAAAQATTPKGSQGQQFGQASGNNGTPAGTIDTATTTTDATSGTNTSGNAQPALSSAYAIEIYHPALVDIGVHYVLPPEKLGTWEQEGEASGLWKREIEFLEFTQPPNKSIAATPTGADKTNPGATYAGGQPVSASDTAATNAKGAGQDAQGAHGL